MPDFRFVPGSSDFSSGSSSDFVQIGFWESPNRGNLRRRLCTSIVARVLDAFDIVYSSLIALSRG